MSTSQKPTYDFHTPLQEGDEVVVFTNLLGREGFPRGTKAWVITVSENGTLLRIKTKGGRYRRMVLVCIETKSASFLGLHPTWEVVLSPRLDVQPLPRSRKKSPGNYPCFNRRYILATKVHPLRFKAGDKVTPVNTSTPHLYVGAWEVINVSSEIDCCYRLHRPPGQKGPSPLAFFDRELELYVEPTPEKAGSGVGV